MKLTIAEQVTGHVRGPVTNHASPVLIRYSALVVALLAHVTVAGAQRPTDQLSWLSGCWERRTANGVVEEQWSSAAGGALLGFSRTLRRDSLVEYEFMRIFSA